MGLFDKVMSLLDVGQHRGGVDLALNDEKAATLLSAIKRYDVCGINQLMRDTREGRWNDRAFYLHVVAPALMPLISSVLDAWCKNEPQSPIPFLIRGAALVEAAWEERSDDGDLQDFAALLERAELDLRKTAALDAADPTPHALLVKVARGRGADRKAIDTAFNAARARDKAHWTAHVETLVSLSPKWGGSENGLLTFARERAAGATSESALAMLVVCAHLEMWNHALAQGPGAARAYLDQGAVKSEIAAALGASVLSNAPPTGPWSVLPWNVAAFYAFVADDKATLAPAMQRIGLGAAEYPWGYASDRQAALLEARQSAGL